MVDIRAAFFDVGGVLLATNGWDTNSRKHCIASFGLDYEEFEDRHQFVSDAFETGRLSLSDYLDRTVFYREREFSREDFWEGMKAESQPYPEALAVVAGLRANADLLLATLNNESAELNRHRIDLLGLSRHFSLFISSGFVGTKKPDRAIYRLALALVQIEPERCVFVDDRELNLECASIEGMQTILYENPSQLRRELVGMGLAIEEDS